MTKLINIPTYETTNEAYLCNLKQVILFHKFRTAIRKNCHPKFM